MDKNRAFTLVELIAIIVILAIILAIAIPGISGIVKNVTKGAFESDAKLLLQQLEYEKLKNDSFDVTAITIDTISNFNLSNANYADLRVGIINNNTYIVLVGRNKWKDLKTCGTRNNMVVVNIDDNETCEDIPLPLYNTSKGVNRPVLANGMIPVKWDGSTWIETTESDNDWYSYTTTDKKWANAMTADESMWVWIPRYVYNISSGWHSSTAGTIDIQFSMGIDDTRGGTVTLDIGTTANSSNNKWTNHPAFTFGITELTGIWVAKFEASGTTNAVDIKANVPSLRNVSVGDTFTSIRNMETNSRYGWGTSGTNIDTHMMKNMEWGAIAYLSKSTYGKTTEIWINNSSTSITGCAGGSVSASSYSGCQNAYNTSNGQQSSTTGTIYGIYDLKGGTYEYIAAYANNGNSALTTNGSSLISADDRYKDVYTVTTDDQTNNYANTLNKKGDAMYETSNNTNGSYSWFSDGSYMANTINPWFVRGGGYATPAAAGIFAFGCNPGHAAISYTFHPVLVVEEGL